MGGGLGDKMIIKSLFDHEDRKVVNHLLDLSDEEIYAVEKGEISDFSSQKHNHIKPWITMRPQTAITKSSEIHLNNKQGINSYDLYENVRHSLATSPQKRINSAAGVERRERAQTGRKTHISNTISARLSRSRCCKEINERIDRTGNILEKKLYTAKDESYMQENSNSLLYKIIGAGSNDRRFKKFLENQKPPIRYPQDGGSRFEKLKVNKVFLVFLRK